VAVLQALHRELVNLSTLVREEEHHAASIEREIAGLKSARWVVWAIMVHACCHRHLSGHLNVSLLLWNSVALA